MIMAKIRDKNGREVLNFKVGEIIAQAIEEDKRIQW